MMLIVRAQNQASGALRRVGKDLSQLGRHRNLQIQQQKMLLKQQNLLRQGLRARNELADITSGSRRLGLERRALSLQKKAADIERGRTEQLRKWQSVSRQIGTMQDRMFKISNDQYRRETQQIRLQLVKSEQWRQRKHLLSNAGRCLRRQGVLKK